MLDANLSQLRDIRADEIIHIDTTIYVYIVIFGLLSVLLIWYFYPRKEPYISSYSDIKRQRLKDINFSEDSKQKIYEFTIIIKELILDDELDADLIFRFEDLNSRLKSYKYRIDDIHLESNLIDELYDFIREVQDGA